MWAAFHLAGHGEQVSQRVQNLGPEPLLHPQRVVVAGQQVAQRPDHAHLEHARHLLRGTVDEDVYDDPSGHSTALEIVVTQYLKKKKFECMVPLTRLTLEVEKKKLVRPMGDATRVIPKGYKAWRHQH